MAHSKSLKTSQGDSRYPGGSNLPVLVNILGLEFGLWSFVCWMLLVCLWSPSAAVASSKQKISAAVDYNRDIRPIFSDNCYACHGPDQNKRKAGLRLDQKDGALSELKSGN